MTATKQRTGPPIAPASILERKGDYFADKQEVFAAFGCILYELDSPVLREVKLPVRFYPGHATNCVPSSEVTFVGETIELSVSFCWDSPWILPGKLFFEFRKNPDALSEWLDGVTALKSRFDPDLFHEAFWRARG